MAPQCDASDRPVKSLSIWRTPLGQRISSYHFEWAQPEVRARIRNAP